MSSRYVFVMFGCDEIQDINPTILIELCPQVTHCNKLYTISINKDVEAGCILPDNH